MNAPQITKKDLTLLVRDRRTLFILVVLPMAFITILGLSTGQLFNEKEKARRVRIAVVNHDESDASGKLMTEVLKLKALEVISKPELRDAKALLDDGKVEALVHIGPNYHERVGQLDLGDLFFTDEGRLAGQLPRLDISVEAGAYFANAAEIVEELVFAFALRTIAPDVLKARDPDLARKFFLRAKRTTMTAARDHEKEPSDNPAKPRPTRSNIVYQTLVPSYTVMFVFFIVNFMARSFINENDLGTLNRLRIAPITRTGLLLGKTTPFLII